MDWQPIETAPKMQALLLYCGWCYEIGHFNTLIGDWVRGEDHATICPTHWLPLPEQPETPDAAPGAA